MDQKVMREYILKAGELFLTTTDDKKNIIYEVFSRKMEPIYKLEELADYQKDLKVPREFI